MPLGRTGFSEAVATALREAETRAAALRAQVGVLKKLQANASVLPHPTVIENYVRNLLETAEADPEKSRALLQRHLGKVVVENNSAGHLEVAGAFKLFASHESSARADCGGALSTLQMTEVPFRRRAS